MIKHNKRKLNLLLFFAVCVFISIAATKPATQNLKSKQPNSNDTGIFKNLKVLPKDISHDSLDHLMHTYTAALGVRCNFCHAFNNGKPDFASDEKEEKGIARYMITMTAGINKTYFNSENSTMPDTITVIKCMVCHRGSPHPDEMNMGSEHDEHHDEHNNMPPPHDSTGKMPPPPPPNQ